MSSHSNPNSGKAGVIQAPDDAGTMEQLVSPPVQQVTNQHLNKNHSTPPPKSLRVYYVCLEINHVLITLCYYLRLIPYSTTYCTTSCTTY